MASPFAHGPVFGSLKETLEALRAHEIATTSRYVAVASTKSFGVTEIDPTKPKQVSWSGEEPYICLGKKVLHCHHVKQKEKYRKEKDRKAVSGDHNSYVRQGRFWAQRTKKLGCPARITIKEVLVFPDVEVGASKKSRASGSSAIRSSLENGKRMFMMTGPGEHANHPVGELAGFSQRVDSSLVGEIHKLVDDGVSRPDEIQRHLKTHVKSVGHDVPKTNRRFYPTTRTILNHMDCHQKKTKKSTDDQQNVKNLKFLLVYQSTWMKKLLGRYGNQMTMLDATYRTSRYALPLFFLAVRTNVDHQIVGVFIVEDETTSSIKEALDLIVRQNPQWKPEYYMTDFDEREISAMDHFFPEAKWILCDFHVVQAWKRWLIKKKNGVHDEAGTLAALQKLRMAATIPEFDTSLKELKASSLWCPISSYLEKVWLPQKKKWAHCYRSGDIPVGIHTNNGIEGLNSSLKKNYLHGKTVMTITKMVGTVIKIFLPDKHKCYIDENVKMTGTLKTYDETVPEFLKKRPPSFIQHCMKRIELSRDCKEVIRIDEGNFSINTYQICTGDSEAYPRCSCPDFRHYILPCKHLFRAITEANVVHWDRLSSTYRASPYINVDDEVLEKHSSGASLTDPVSLENMRKKVATKLMLFEEYLTGCCPKCGYLVEDEDMMKCCSCLRSYHFKPYCIEDDINEMNDSDQFECKLCRINYWPVGRSSKVGNCQGTDVPWTEKDKVLTKLRQPDTADVEFIKKETVTVKKHPERTRKRKRQSSSFIYPPLKKPTKLYCLCKRPNNGKLYWQCEDCKEWFHPACVGHITDNEPDIFICPVCLKKVPLLQLPVPVIERIFREVVLTDGDIGYLRLSLVCSSFQVICSNRNFRSQCHLSWLLSLRPQAFWKEDNKGFFHSFEILECQNNSCKEVYKDEGDGFCGGHGIRGEVTGFYDSASNPGYCCVFVPNRLVSNVNI